MNDKTETAGAEGASPFLTEDNVHPKTGRVLDTPMMNPEYPGIVFPGFDREISPFGAYIVRKGDLWWSARCERRDGTEETGMYGVLVTCRDNCGNIVVWARTPHVWPRRMENAPLYMWRAANSLASSEEADALRRVRMGLSVRPAPSGQHGTTLFEEPGVDERGVRRVGRATLARTPEPYRDNMRPFGTRARPDDAVLMPRPRKTELSTDVAEVVDSVRRDVAKGEEAT